MARNQGIYRPLRCCRCCVVDGGGVGAPRRGDRVVGDSESKKKKRKKSKTKKKATRLDERAGAVVGRGGRGGGHIPEITPEKR